MATTTLSLIHGGHDAAIGDKHEALERYRRAADPAVADGLFRAARRLREQHLAPAPRLSADLRIAAPCTLRRPCAFCPHPPRSAGEVGDVVAAAHALVALGYRRLRLSGGIRFPRAGEPSGGHDAQVVRLVLALRAAVDVDIEVDVGPSLTRDGVRTLKQLGVAAVGCALDVLNPAVFERCKPGDRLTERIRLLETCEREGMPFRSTIRLGLGETDEDRIGHLFFLRRFPMLRHLDLVRHAAYPEVAAPGCGPWPLARLTAVARLLLPTLDIGLASDAGTDDVPLWWLAGGGSEAVGATVTMARRREEEDGETRLLAVGERLVLRDRAPALQRHFADLGLDAGIGDGQRASPASPAQARESTAEG